MKSGLIDRCLAPKGTWPHLWQKRATLNPVRAGEKLPTHCFGESKITSTRWGLVISRLPDFCNGAPFWWAGAAVMDMASALPRVFPLSELRAVSRRKLRKTCLNLLSNVGQVGNDEIFELECSIHVRRLVHLDEYKLLPQVWLHGAS